MDYWIADIFNCLLIANEKNPFWNYCLSLTIACLTALLCAAPTVNTTWCVQAPECHTATEQRYMQKWEILPLACRVNWSTPSPLTSTTLRVAATTSGTSSFSRSVMASFRKVSVKLQCCSGQIWVLHEVICATVKTKSGPFSNVSC